MTKKAYDKIAEGLREARSIVRGDYVSYAITHVRRVKRKMHEPLSIVRGKPNPLTPTREIIAAHIETLCEEIPPREARETADWVINQVLCDAWSGITPQMIKAGAKVLSSYEAKAPPDLLATEVFGAMLLVLINSQDPEE